MISKLRAYFKSKSKLDDDNLRLKHQITLMQEHMSEQKESISQLERKLHLAKKMWDISNNTKTYQIMILYYILVGLVIGILLDLSLKGSEISLKNSERVITILLWPVMLLWFLYYIIKDNS